MKRYAGYPIVPCPECSSPDVEIDRPVKPERLFGPGEWAVYHCGDCGTDYTAVVPEPAEV